MVPRAADARATLAGTREPLRPPPRLTLSEWADRKFYLSAESSAEAGRWRTLPYQRGIMDAITDQSITFVTVMKSARVGFTKIVDAAIGCYMEHDPCPIMVVQPTVEDAEGYSKEEIAPMLRDCPALAAIVREPTAKVSSQTILQKTFPGGSLSMVGANSGRGFRRVSRRVVIFDEIDGYPPSAGAEGDQIKLGIKRSEFYWNRKIICGSTPLIAGASRIEQRFEDGDQRRYYIPCPQCGHRDYLVFSKPANGQPGHWMAWPEGAPEKAHYVCSKNGCIIDESSKLWMLEHGEWVAHNHAPGHASFHVWSAYSVAPNATWGQIAAEFLAAKDEGPDSLKTWVNTTLGETWAERGDAPDYERLFERREQYQIGSVPDDVLFLTAGVDVQKDRFVYEVVGWRANKESWSVEIGIIWGDTADDASYAQLDELLDRRFGDQQMPIRLLAIDAGHNSQAVYAWARRHPMTRVIAVRGTPHEMVIIGAPRPVDVTLRGKTLKRGYKYWPVGVNTGKAELYGWLRLPLPDDGQPYKKGFCHFPEYDKEFFKQLTAEHLVKTRTRTGFTKLTWEVQPGRENHWLDTRIYARAAASVLGLDRYRTPAPAPARKPAPAAEREATPAPTPERSQRQRKKPSKGGWLQGGCGAGGWLGKRR